MKIFLIFLRGIEMTCKPEKDMATRFIVVNLSNGSIFEYYQTTQGAEPTTASPSDYTEVYNIDKETQ